MSDSHAADAHGHGGHGAEHHPHVLPLAAYFGVWAALVVFTVLTVGASYLDLGRTANIAIAILIATMKAGMVAAIFMHLWFDKKFNTVIFISALLFLAIFISFTMFDTETRGMTGRIAREKPADTGVPFSANQVKSLDGSQDSAALAKKSAELALPPPVLPAGAPFVPPAPPPPAPVEAAPAKP